MTRERSDRDHDKTLEDTFPASDAPANSGITGAESPSKPSQRRGDDARPTARPTADRHAAETAYHSEQEDPTTDKASR